MSSSTVSLRLTVEGGAQVNQALGSVDDKLNHLEQKSSGVAESASKVGSSLLKIASALGAAFTVKEFVEAADTMTLMSARLKLATGNSQEFATAQADVYRIAQTNNVGLQEATQLYTKLSDPVKRLGGTTREVGAIVDSFATSLRVGGASTQEAAAATLQFAQAMGSGKLQGDEFRSIAEASPRFMRALAEGMNVPIEKLKEMAGDGRLTADVVGNALVKSLGKLKSEAASLPDTVGGAMTRLKNDVLVAIDDLNKSSGLTLGLAELVNSFRTDLVPAIKGELGSAFKAVGDYINDNREQIGEVWQVAKALIGDVWAIAKAASAVSLALVDWSVSSGSVKLAFESIRLVVAGVVDGVDILGAVLALSGAQLLKLAGLFSGTAKKMAEDAEAYASSVFQRFADGGSAVAKLGREMDKSAQDSAKLKEALAASGVSASDNARELSRMSEKAADASSGFKTLKGRTGELTEEQKKQSASVQKLIGDLADKLAVGGMEAAQQSKLTDGQKLALGVMEKLRDGTIKGTVAERERIGVLLNQLLVNEQREIADKNALAASEAARKATGALTLEELKNADAIAAQVAKQREHNETIGLTAQQLAELERRKIDDALATAEQSLQQALKAPVDAATIEAITLQVEGLRELKRLKDEGVIQQATVDMAKSAADAWQKTVEQIGQGLTDSLFRAFESGKNFFKTMWEGIHTKSRSNI